MARHRWNRHAKGRKQSKLRGGHHAIVRRPASVSFHDPVKQRVFPRQREAILGCLKHYPAAHAHRASLPAPPVEPLSLALYNGRALAYGLLCRHASDSARSSLPASDTAFRYVGRARRSADDRSNLARDFSLFVAFPYGCRPLLLDVADDSLTATGDVDVLHGHSLVASCPQSLDRKQALLIDRH